MQARQIAKVVFQSVTYKEAGLYKCLAENAGGRKQKYVQVNVLCKFDGIIFQNFYVIFVINS